jgi:hypothetical protein
MTAGFTQAQQKEHRETFIKECRQKAWGAACHANWIGGQLDKLIEDCGKLKKDDETLVAAHYRLLALHRLIFLSVGIAYNRVRSHCHWTSVHRVHLKARRDFTMSEIVPAISFAQPFPTARAI